MVIEGGGEGGGVENKAGISHLEIFPFPSWHFL